MIDISIFDSVPDFEIDKPKLDEKQVEPYEKQVEPWEKFDNLTDWLNMMEQARIDMPPMVLTGKGKSIFEAGLIYAPYVPRKFKVKVYTP